MDKNDKKLEVAKRLDVEHSKRKVLKKQLELSAKVIEKVAQETDKVCAEMGLESGGSSGDDSLGMDGQDLLWKLNLLEQKGVEYLARFTMRIAEELREEYRNRGEFSLLKAAEDVEAILENNNYEASQNSKAFLKMMSKKRAKDEQFLHNIGLVKKAEQEELDVYGSSDKNKEGVDFKRGKTRNKDNVTLKSYRQLRDLAVKDLNFKVSDS